MHNKENYVFTNIKEPSVLKFQSDTGIVRSVEHLAEWNKTQFGMSMAVAQQTWKAAIIGGYATDNFLFWWIQISVMSSFTNELKLLL